jgi:hypothetical protein
VLAISGRFRWRQERLAHFTQAELVIKETAALPRFEVTRAARTGDYSTRFIGRYTGLA